MDATASSVPAESASRLAATLRWLRIGLFCLLFVEIAGLTGELLLLDHYELHPAEALAEVAEDFEIPVEDVAIHPGWKNAPLLLLGGTLLMLVVHLILRWPLLVRLVQLSMILCIAGGGWGMYLHFCGNAEFNPTLQGAELFWKALTQRAMPVLAPGAMIQFGLMGLVYTFRHPFLRKPAT